MTFVKPSNLCNSKAYHSNPRILDPLNPLDHSNSFGDDPNIFTAANIDDLVKSHLAVIARNEVTKQSYNLAYLLSMRLLRFARND